MMGGAVKRYEAAAYDERQPAPPRLTTLVGVCSVYSTPNLSLGREGKSNM